MKYLRVTSAADPQAARLLERPGTRVAEATPGESLALGPNVLLAHNALPVIIPRPLPNELIAADFTPGR